LNTQKDPLTLLEAAKEVIQEEPKTVFTLVGDGEKYEDCEHFVTGNYLKKNICLAGWQTDVVRYYRTHHIFIASLYMRLSD
jgi:glycosyltransferase involved in cell wall biosynthesis